MTQKEFEERTGLKLSADGYTEVEECYMNTDLDKDAFCKLWMENPTALKEIERKTVLVRELYEERKCLKSQIKPFKPEVKDGYIFITTDEQKNNGLFSIAKCGSKRGLLSALSEYIKDDEDFKREFTI